MSDIAADMFSEQVIGELKEHYYAIFVESGHKVMDFYEEGMSIQSVVNVIENEIDQDVLRREV